MKYIAIVLASLISLISAKPGFLSVPVSYATLTPGQQLDPDGVLLDNPEIGVTKAQYATTQDNEKINLSGGNIGGRPSIPRVLSLLQRSSLLINDGTVVLTPSAPIGADGRVVDTAEVTAAKAAHAAAHANERLNLANEAARSTGVSETGYHHDDAIITTEAEADRRILDTPEISTTRMAHAAAQDNEKINPANEAERSTDSLTQVVNDPIVPLVLSKGVVALLPVGLDGRPVYTPGIHVATRINEKDSLVNDVRSVDALAVASPSLAYGRLVY